MFRLIFGESNGTRCATRVFGLAVLTLFLGLPLWVQARMASFDITPVSPPKKAYKFELSDSKGKMVQLEDYRGKTVLLNFWASWCGPCIEEMPSLSKLHEKFKDKNFAIVAISVDKSEKAALRMAEKYKIPFTVLLDPRNSVSRKYRTHALPMTFLIDPKGNSVGVVQGARHWASEEAFQFLENFIEKGSLEVKATKAQTQEAKTEFKIFSAQNAPNIWTEVVGPKNVLHPGEMFRVKMKLTWKEKNASGDVGILQGFRPPEANLPEGVQLLSTAMQAQTQKDHKILFYDLDFALDRHLDFKEKMTLSLGPFQNAFFSEDGPALLVTDPIELQVKKKA
jgi:peroxiredoxin